MFLPIIFYRSFDRIFCKDTTVDFDGREAEFFCDVGVCNTPSFIKTATFNPFGKEAGRRDSTSASVGFKFSIFDNSIVIHLICNSITSPQAGAPTMPVPTFMLLCLVFPHYEDSRSGPSLYQNMTIMPPIIIPIIKPTIHTIKNFIL